MDENAKEISLELYNMLDETFWKQLKDNVLNLNFNKNDLIPSEASIFMKSAFKSITLSLEVLENNDFVDSMSLLRSAFESTTCGLAIYIDSETYNQYKYLNFNVYKAALEKKQAQMSKNNPKIKISKINQKDFLMTPGNIRNTISKNNEKLFGKMFLDKTIQEVKEELDEYYRYLCSFTHPTVIRVYAFQIQEDDIENDLKHFLKLNIYYSAFILMVSCLIINNYFIDEHYNNLYGLLVLSSFSSFSKIEKTKEIINKYKKYIYFENNKEYISNKTEKVKKLKNELTNFDINKADFKKADNIIKEVFDYFNVKNKR